MEKKRKNALEMAQEKDEKEEKTCKTTERKSKIKIGKRIFRVWIHIDGSMG